MGKINEKLSIPQLVKRFPGLNAWAVRSWISKGVRGHKLKVNRIGGKIVVPLAALRAFIVAVNGEEQAASMGLDKDEAAVAVARTLAGQTQAGELCEDQSGD